MKKIRRLIFLLLVLFILDRLAKYLAILKLPEEGVFVLPFFQLKLFLNPRLALSLPLNNVVVMAVAAIILTVIVYYLIRAAPSPKIFLALGLIFDGAFSNLLDRLRFGGVVDFFNLAYLPAFNLADSYILIGTLLLFFTLKKRHSLTLKTETAVDLRQVDSK